MDKSITPNHRNSISSPLTLAGRVDGNSHGLETLRVYEHDTPLNIPYMDNHKVKADQLTQCWGQSWSADLVWRSRLSMTQPLNIHIWKKMDIRKVKLMTWPSLPVCPMPSVWSQIWKWKHLKSVLNILAMYILQKSFKINWEKHLESSWSCVFCGHR